MQMQETNKFLEFIHEIVSHTEFLTIVSCFIFYASKIYEHVNWKKTQNFIPLISLSFI